MKNIIKKIENKNARISIVGLGYVGLPLAVECAKSGYETIGIDVSIQKVESINKGVNYIGDVKSQELEELVTKRMLSATNDFKVLKDVDAIIICVPTPVDENLEPNMEYIKNSVKCIAENISKDTLIILESTTYPGTTEEIIVTAVEDRNFTIGEDVYVAYSPERVDPGNKNFNTNNTPKVVGGVTENCNKIISLLYKNILSSEIHTVSSPSVAEMEKLLENIFRNVNIGLANEMAIICNKMGINIWEVIDAAATKPYGFMPFYPGPGIGGHCIPVDPWYLTWKSKEFNHNTEMILTSESINRKMDNYIINRIFNILNKEKISINGANIAVYGISYKKDIEDYRESPSLPIISKLLKLNANLTFHDTHVEEFKVDGIDLKASNAGLDQSTDLILLLTNHSGFNYDEMLKSNINIFDTKGIFKNIKNSNVELL